jgi:hypothetical protein
MRKVLALAALSAVAGIFAAQAPANHNPAHNKTWVCHKTGSGWVAIRPATRAQVRHHLRHGDMVATGATTRQQARTMCNALPTPLRGGTVLTGNLTGTAGTGLATLRLRGTLVCFNFTNLPTGFTFSAAHIHSGSATGPIVLPFTSTGQTSGCVKASRQLVRQILANPAGFVVNLHNATGAVVLSAPLAPQT